MLDFMFAVENQESYDIFVSSLGCECAIDVLGPIYEESTTASYIIDEGGNEVEVDDPALIKDARIHFNLRVLSPLTQSEITELKNNPLVEWISPEVVHSPRRIWFGGMFYA